MTFIPLIAVRSASITAGDPPLPLRSADEVVARRWLERVRSCFQKRLGGARKFVFPRLLEAEIDAARPGFRKQSRITPDNYTFEMVGTESIRGRPAYAIAI